MGNRILKESILSSLEIDKLTWFEEVLFYRLIVSADDYGVCHADPVLLAHTLFPRKENITRRMVGEALKHLEQLHLIHRYHTAGKGNFLHLTSWEQHQRLRNTRRKYPGPDDATGEKTTPEAEEEKSEATALKVKETGEKGKRPPAEATENTALQSQMVPEKISTAETDPEPPTVITLPLNDGTEFSVTQQDIEEYASLYRAVDVIGELRAMRGWCLSNEKKRKTRYGIKRFINGWLARTQDKGGTQNLSPGRILQPNNPYLTMVCEEDAV